MCNTLGHLNRLLVVSQVAELNVFQHVRDDLCIRLERSLLLVVSRRLFHEFNQVVAEPLRRYSVVWLVCQEGHRFSFDVGHLWHLPHP